MKQSQVDRRRSPVWSDVEEAQNLASDIRIGSLSLELEELRSSVVAAQLGERSNFTPVLWQVLIGSCDRYSVHDCCISYYLGLVAGIALILYTAIVLITLNAFDITLTLPGIAGIILGIGMAVDANVIIYATYSGRDCSRKLSKDHLLKQVSQKLSAQSLMVTLQH